MQIYQIKYFLALAKHQNFTAAAEICNVSQPALTRAIQRLEHHMGGALFQRFSRKTQLTPLGLAVFPHLQKALDFADSATLEARKLSASRNAMLSIGMMSTIGPAHIARIFGRLATMMPKVEVNIMRGSGQQVLEWLLAGDVEIGLASISHYPENVKANLLFTEHFGVAVAADHRLGTFDAVAISDLLGETLLERTNCERLQDFRKLLQQHASNIHVNCRSDDENLIQELVAAGAGFAFTPESLVTFPGIVIRPIAGHDVQRSISAIVMRGVQHTEPKRKFLRLLSANIYGNEGAFDLAKPATLQKEIAAQALAE